MGRTHNSDGKNLYRSNRIKPMPKNSMDKKVCQNIEIAELFSEHKMYRPRFLFLHLRLSPSGFIVVILTQWEKFVFIATKLRASPTNKWNPMDVCTSLCIMPWWMHKIPISLLVGWYTQPKSMSSIAVSFPIYFRACAASNCPIYHRISSFPIPIFHSLSHCSAFADFLNRLA